MLIAKKNFSLLSTRKKKILLKKESKIWETEPFRGSGQAQPYAMFIASRNN